MPVAHLFLEGAGDQSAELTQAVVDSVTTTFLNYLMRNRIFGHFRETFRPECAQICFSIHKYKCTHPATSFSRLHLSGCSGRHGAQRRADIPLRRWSRETSVKSSLLKAVVFTSGLNNLPILIRAFFLHLYGLIQLAVRGAEVVIPFHSDESTIVLQRERESQSVLCLRLTCVCPGSPGASLFEAPSFPTVSFQLWSQPAGAGSGGGAANQEAAAVLSDSAVGPNIHQCAFTKSKRCKERRALTLWVILVPVKV